MGVHTILRAKYYAIKIRRSQRVSKSNKHIVLMIQNSLLNDNTEIRFHK